MLYLSRVYFSRYFYSIFKNSIKYKNCSLIHMNQGAIFYSDLYYYNFKLNVKGHNTSDLWSISSTSHFFSRNYFFFFRFPYRGDFNVFYDYYWKPYECDYEFFKKFIITFIRFKLKYFTNFQLILFVNFYRKFK